MIYQYYIPSPPLRQFVDRFIFFEAVKRPHLLDRFLPDGNVELLIDMYDVPQYIHDNDTLKEIQSCQHVWASGVRTEPITIPSGRESSMMVVSFKKGMAYPFFPLPMNELAGYVVDADLLWGEKYRFLRESVLECAQIAGKFKIMEKFLMQELSANFVRQPCVEFALERMIRHPDRTVLKSLNEKIGYSQKHFIDMFKRQIGLTPKTYLKLMRFQKAVIEIEASNAIDWTHVAHDCGFFDQAHFINDFRDFSGFTPNEYLRQKNDILNYVPIA